jgi:hypothetical protein
MALLRRERKEARGRGLHARFPQARRPHGTPGSPVPAPAGPEPARRAVDQPGIVRKACGGVLTAESAVSIYATHKATRPPGRGRLMLLSERAIAVRLRSGRREF